MPTSVCGVRVAIWGAEEGTKGRMKHTIEDQLFGGNTGHVALSITFPANEQSERWVKQYCGQPPIPVERHSVKHFEAVQNEQGEWVQSDKVIFEEEVYTVTGSWWPGTGGFFFGSSINSDGYDEREGVHCAWDAKALEFIDVEKRVHAGKLGRTEMMYGPLNIEHQRGQDENSRQRKHINLQAQIKMTSQIIDAIKLAIEKFETKQENLESNPSSNNRLSQTEINLLDRFVADWRNQYQFNPEQGMSSDQYIAIIHKLKQLKSSHKEALESLEEALDQLGNIYMSQEQIDASKGMTAHLDEGIYHNGYMEVAQSYQMVLNLLREHNGQSTIEIDEVMREQLTQAAAFAGQTLELGDGQTTISLSQAQHLYATMDEYLTKQNTLRALYRYLDPNVPYYLPGDTNHVMLHNNPEFSFLIQNYCRLIGLDVSQMWQYKQAYNRTDILYLIDQLHQKEVHLEQTSPALKDAESNFLLAHRAIEKDFRASEQVMQYQRLQSLVGDIGGGYKFLNYVINQIVKDGGISESLWDDMQDDFIDMLEDAYLALGYGPDWQVAVFGSMIDLNQLSPEEFLSQFPVSRLNELQGVLKHELGRLYPEMVDLMPALSTYHAEDFESFLTMGLPPEVDHFLPLDAQSAPGIGVNHGMNVEAMLARMQSYANQETFDLKLNNCSSFADNILAAGASTPHLRSIFEDRVFGAIATPQAVSNSCLKYKKERTRSPADNLFKRIYRKKPIENRLGDQARVLLAPDASKKQKRAAGAKFIALGIVSCATSFARSLLNPRQAMSDCIGMTKFAMSKNHLGFKVGVGAIGIIGAVVLAPIVVATSIVTAPTMLTKWAVDKLTTRRIRKEGLHVDIATQSQRERDRKQQALKDRLGKNEIDLDNRIVKITEKDPIKAMQQFEAELIKGNVPSFSAKSTQSIQKMFTKLEDSDKQMAQQRYHQLVEFSVEAVRALQKGQPMPTREPNDFAKFELATSPSIIQRVAPKKRARPVSETTVQPDNILEWLQNIPHHEPKLREAIVSLLDGHHTRDLEALAAVIQNPDNFTRKRAKTHLFNASNPTQDRQLAAQAFVFDVIREHAKAKIENLMSPLFLDAVNNRMLTDDLLTADLKTTAAIEARKAEAYQIYQAYKPWIPEAHLSDFKKLNDYIHQPVLPRGANAQLKVRMESTEQSSSLQARPKNI